MGSEIVVGSAARWVRSALNGEGTGVVISLADAKGHLRDVWTEGYGSEPTRGGSADRLRVFHTAQVMRTDLDQDRASVILPLVVGEAKVGVLEVTDRGEAIERNWVRLETAATQLALMLQVVAEDALSHGRLDILKDVTRLGRALLRAPRGEPFVRTAVRFVFESFHVPVAGWYASDELEMQILGPVRGVGVEARRRIRAEMGSIPAWEGSSSRGRTRLTKLFGRVVGVPRVAVLGGIEGVVVLVGDPDGSLGEPLGSLQLLIEEVLRQRAPRPRPEERPRELDLALASVAHELTGPLTGARAALEHVMGAVDGEPIRGLLRRTHRELEHLLNLVDPLLRWSVGIDGLQPRPADLVSVVHDAVALVLLETGDGHGHPGERILIEAPASLQVHADAATLKGAIANVLRNALAYSPREEQVRVAVERRDGWAIVNVRDNGPGISSAERDVIFDPFARGQVGESSRAGRGLGLFIARRVLEAHGGTVTLLPSEAGATFRIRLPVEGVSRSSTS